MTFYTSIDPTSTDSTVSWGRGGLEITSESGAALEADLRNSMAAAGARAVLMGAGSSSSGGRRSPK